MTDPTRYRFESEHGDVELTGELTFGRSDECDVKLTAGHPSRRHARVSVQDDGVLLEDLESANGTYVDGERLTAPRLLTGGEKVNLDLTEYRLVAVPPVAASSDATVVRPMPTAGDATVVRPLPADHAATAEPRDASSKQAADPEPAKPSEQIVVAKDRSNQAPGSWADPERQNHEGTMLIDPSALSASGTPAASPDAPVDGPSLKVSNGLAAGRVFKLQADDVGEWRIGSADGSDIVLSDEGVSGLHAKLMSNAGRWKLTDQMSANGTFVNDKKVNVAYLANGDRIRFGAIECVCRLPGGAAGNALGRSKTRKPLMIGLVTFAVTALILALLLTLA